MSFYTVVNIEIPNALEFFFSNLVLKRSTENTLNLDVDVDLSLDVVN